jgi:hypothetical protein
MAGKTFDEQLKAAGLNWEVKLSPMQFGDEFQYQTEKRKVAYRSDTGAFLDTYTTRQPWQNQDILGH